MHETRASASTKGDALSTDESQTENKQVEERDELEDLEVKEQQADDVRGGARARKPMEP
jgi:hypothetical protein